MTWARTGTRAGQNKANIRTGANRQSLATCVQSIAEGLAAAAFGEGGGASASSFGWVGADSIDSAGGCAPPGSFGKSRFGESGGCGAALRPRTRRKLRSER